MTIGGRTIDGVGSYGAASFDRAVGGGPTVGLVHSRLAIIDLSRGGHQPMASASGTSWVTYNGEIYNYRAIRERLAQNGPSLRSRSDTEALVELIDREGIESVGRLRGMFAFAWWDDRARRLWLCRDRFGIKPLVYARPSSDVVVFASDPQALAASGLVTLAPKPEGVVQFLVRGSVDASAGFWNGTHSVAPGSWVSCEADGVSSRTYWSLDQRLIDEAPVASGSVSVAAREAREAITASVEAHLVSDVPVAVFLSGGIDSTALLASARRVTSAPLQTFTVTLPGSPLDETAAARAAAARFESVHTELCIDDLDVDAALDEFFEAMPQPTIDGFNTFLVARAARNAGARVALSGVGGDEWFGGYPSFVEVPRLARLLRIAGAAGRWVPWIPGGGGARAGRLRAIARAAPRSLADVWWEYRRIFTDAETLELTGVAPSRPAWPSVDAAPFDVVRYLEVRHFLEPQLLADADAFTMCRALELRTPLVDHVVAEHVIRAGRWRRSPGASFKQTLFRALPELGAGGPPERTKQGFVLPYDAWLREALTTRAPRRLRDAASRLRHPRYAPFVRRFLRGELHWSRVWALYVFDRFVGAAT